jgi:hypothetical protein
MASGNITPQPPGSGKKNKVALYVVGGVVLVLSIFVFGSISAVKAPSSADPADVNHCGASAGVFLNLLKNGDSTASGLWKPGLKVAGIINVRSYSQVRHGDYLNNDKPYKIPRVYYEYDVESSTKGGIPIRQRWDIVMEPTSPNALGQPCSIVELKDAQ